MGEWWSQHLPTKNLLILAGVQTLVWHARTEVWTHFSGILYVDGGVNVSVPKSC